MALTSSFLCHFDVLKDPRRNTHRRRHNLHDILVITILGTICGADNWAEICEFARAKETWLSTFLELPSGIPSHDTFGRVFGLLNPETFNSCFMSWIESLSINVEGKVIAIDGKTLRGSGNKRKGKKPLHIVSAWVSENSILLGQVRTRDKSNEIKAIPELLNMIDIKGSVVTIDAIGCQSGIAKKIREKEADYVLSLKDNQPNLHQVVQAVFNIGESTQFKKILHRRRVDKTHDHGRRETRTYTLVSARDPLAFELHWPGLKGIGKVEVKRVVNNEVAYETRYFLTSISYENINSFMHAVRHHWGIEIGLHWSLDVAFKEDLNQVHKGHGAANLGMVRRIALNMLKQEKTLKRGIACKRKRAGWDENYLLQALLVGQTLSASA